MICPDSNHNKDKYRNDSMLLIFTEIFQKFPIP